MLSPGSGLASRTFFGSEKQHLDESVSHEILPYCGFGAALFVCVRIVAAARCLAFAVA